MYALGKMAEMAINRQIINKNSSEIAKGPFGQWRFWQKMAYLAKMAELAIAKIAKL